MSVMVTSFLFSNLVPLEVRVNNKDPQLHEYNQNISIPKNEVFQCVISAGNSFKWTFFGCVIPCVVAFKFEIPKKYTFYQVSRKCIGCYLNVSRYSYS